MPALPTIPLLLLLVAVAFPVTANVECPELRVADEICAIAPEFAFNDGCNDITCMGNGMLSSTRRKCQTASSPEDRRRCHAAAKEVFDRLGPFTCDNVEPDRVCRRGGGGGDQRLRFTDGCNDVVCGDYGSVGSSTMRACPQGDPEGAYCRFVESQLPNGGDDDNDGQRRRKRQQQQELACPDLAAKVICKRSTNGLTYSDGCNTVTCHGSGIGKTTLKYCPGPGTEPAGLAYCQQAAQALQAKIASAKLRNRCLEPADVCKGSERTAYNNGCNRCFCTKPGEASCTRRSCPKVLMTDEEFAAYCEERGAGVH